MTLQEAQQVLTQALSTLYDAREASNITGWVLEYLTGWSRVDRIVHKQEHLQAAQEQQLRQYRAELLTHKPVQYVLHEAWFDGMRLYVDEHVLIPRPETEELVEWITQDALLMTNDQLPMTNGRVLDIGTGSGCIPIALKKRMRGADMYACDVSEGALGVARRNGAALGAPVEWLLLDILDAAQWERLPVVDIMVSNPPYIPLRDKATMHDNVLLHEPHLALFVENNDPLLFYRTIAELARVRLAPGGSVYAEIHEDLGDATRTLFTEYGFSDVEVRKDMQGKDRMIKARASA